MSNVIPLRTTRAPDAGNAPASDPSNPVAVLVATIDKALGDTWSFDLVHHEVVGDETIVFANLVVDGRHRIGIGGTGGKGPLVARLNAATLDALTRAAAWMGIAVGIGSDVQQDAQDPGTTTPEPSSGTRITRKQLDYLYSLARDRQIPRDRLAARCIEDFHKKPEFLTRTEASAVIESLKKEVA